MDVIVVGGGIIGLLTARELVHHGAVVTLIERGEFARESSWAGGGILSPLYPWRAPESITALCAYNRDVYPPLSQTLLERTGIDAEYTTSGLLALDVDDLAPAQTWATEHHVETHALTATDLPRAYAALSAEFTSGLLLPQVAQIRNPRLTRALAVELQQRNITLHAHCSVSQVLVEQGRVRGVTTSNGIMRADSVVIAGGAWTQDLLAPLGVEINITPVKGQMMLIRSKPGVVPHIILHDECYLIPRRDGRVLVGSTVEYAGFDKHTTESARHQLLGAAYRTVPALQHDPVEMQWAGLRPGTPDGIPYIGEHPGIAGLYVNTGHFRNGVVMAPGSARLLRELLTRQPTFIDPTPYRAQRG